jgi:hypothetical protein
MQDENEAVEGVLYEMPDSDLAKLDGAEGYRDHYHRISVTHSVHSKAVLGSTCSSICSWAGKGVHVRFDSIQPSRGKVVLCTWHHADSVPLFRSYLAEIWSSNAND